MGKRCKLIFFGHIDSSEESIKMANSCDDYVKGDTRLASDITLHWTQIADGHFRLVSGGRQPFGAGLNGQCEFNVGHLGLGTNVQPSLKWPTDLKV